MRWFCGGVREANRRCVCFYSTNRTGKTSPFDNLMTAVRQFPRAFASVLTSAQLLP
jgi:hypothetical protein